MMETTAIEVTDSQQATIDRLQAENRRYLAALNDIRQLMPLTTHFWRFRKIKEILLETIGVCEAEDSNG